MESAGERRRERRGRRAIGVKREGVGVYAAIVVVFARPHFVEDQAIGEVVAKEKQLPAHAPAIIVADAGAGDRIVNPAVAFVDRKVTRPASLSSMIGPETFSLSIARCNCRTLSRTTPRARKSAIACE